MSIAVVAAIAIIAMIFVAGIIGYGISIYNSLVQVKNNTEKAWKNIDVLLLQRHDELPNLVETVKGCMKHEKDVLERLIKLRSSYNEAENMNEKIRLENQLNREMLRMHHVWESYPDLKTNQNFIKLQERISGLESSIADRREFFNDSVNIYNIQIERFPEVVLANMFGYKKKEYLDVPEDKKGDVEVDLSTVKPVE